MAFDDAAMRAAIGRKRDGDALEPEIWHALVPAFLAGVVDEAAMAALLMACVIRGLAPSETAALTAAFVASGETATGLEDAVDKHSSGGVGDSLSLIAVPWVAASGVRVAKLSGRALGHTGGTLDKLEAVPGVDTRVALPRFREIVRTAGCAIAAQTAELVPADRRIYALRDRTATVAEAGLIAASIVSKKIAGGAGAIVYDVKAGAGAFMPTREAAFGLAETIVAATRAFGRRALALVTEMDAPLGRAIGSGIETIEARDVLTGAERDPVLLAAARTVADAMLEASGAAEFAGAPARAAALDRALASGAAFERFEALLGTLGAGPRALRDLAVPASRHELRATRSGFVRRVRPVPIGLIARALTTADGPCAGLRLAVRPGDAVRAGERLAEIYGADRSAELAAAFEIGDTPPEVRPFVLGRVGEAGATG